MLGEGFRRGTVAKEVAWDVDNLLAGEQLQVDPDTRAAIDERVFWLTVELNKTLLRRAAGDYTPDPKLGTFPVWCGPASPPVNTVQAAVPVTEVFEAWAKERRFAGKTKDLWKSIIGKVTAHVGHEDASRITDVDIIAWKDALVASSLAPKTIANNLTVAKTFFRWAAINKRITTDPAVNVEYKAKRKPGDRKLSYSDEQARSILLAARKEKDGVKRWAPWLCAFTGARIDEICGAMVADVQRDAIIDYIKVDTANREEGGSVKNEHSIRNVPLHPALIAEGFLEYVGKLPKDGPLFPGIKPDRYGKRGGNPQRSAKLNILPSRAAQRLAAPGPPRTRRRVRASFSSRAVLPVVIFQRNRYLRWSKFGRIFARAPALHQRGGVSSRGAHHPHAGWHQRHAADCLNRELASHPPQAANLAGNRCVRR